MNEYLVSIITPSYNCSETFFDTFLSVINQSFKNWEWIIVDDFSSDNSVQLIKSLIKNYCNIKLIELPSNFGSSHARNVGLDQARGKYLTFLDSDDMIDENYLESQLSFIKENGPIITSGYRRLAKKTISSFMPRQNISYRKLLYGCDTSCLTTMYDSSIITNVRFNESLQKDEDYIFWLDILKKGFVVKTNKKILATYRIRKQSKNGNKIKLLKPIYIVYRKTLKMNLIRTYWHIFCYFVYGCKKYFNVR